MWWLINTVHTNRWDQHKDAQRQRPTSSPRWTDGSATQSEDPSANETVLLVTLTASCCQTATVCPSLDWRRSQRLRISNGRADHLHHLRLMEATRQWGELQPGIKLLYQISLVFWQSDAGITRQKQIAQSSKLHLFLPLNLRAGELERCSPSLHMAP